MSIPSCLQRRSIACVPLGFFDGGRLPDGEEMFLACLDSAILRTLFGQNTDSALYVKGPISTQDQSAMLIFGQ